MPPGLLAARGAALAAAAPPVAGPSTRELERINFSRVNEKVARLIEETIRKWDLAGLQR